MPSSNTLVDLPTRSQDEGYTVVARRYRPQSLDEVVGQDHVVQGLRNAIAMNRVTHAYLFCGTRGVGKTSVARIFAKCLNCVRGPTDDPCLECDICRAIASGQDVDVIEIDGASNNGVEAVRELRQNVSLRPSRCRYKIYYIDEVHMLSQGAFNALLKTLEEPPEHVKFVFATTEAHKIPITVLSRCQRYDFAAIGADQIVSTLKEICTKEGVEADVDALEVVARRAAGSMRDAQSLLEQLLSTTSDRLTAAGVHELLGIAGDDRILELLEALSLHDAAKALLIVDESINTGVQPSELLGGAIDFLRDVMVRGTGARDVPMLAAAPRQLEQIDAIASRWSLDTILSALQILAESRGKLRGSPHGRLLVELALARVARLENLVDLGTLVNRLTEIEATAPREPRAPISTHAGSITREHVDRSARSSADVRSDEPSADSDGDDSPGKKKRNHAAATVDRRDGEGSEPRTPAPEPRQTRSRVNREPDRSPASAVQREPAAAQSAVQGDPSVSMSASATRPAAAASRPSRDQGASSVDINRSSAAADFTIEHAQAAWESILGKIAFKLRSVLALARLIEVDPPDTLVVGVPETYNGAIEECRTPEASRAVESKLSEAFGRAIRVRFEIVAGEQGSNDRPAAVEAHRDDPLVKRMIELFDARLYQIVKGSE